MAREERKKDYLKHEGSKSSDGVITKREPHCSIFSLAILFPNIYILLFLTLLMRLILDITKSLEENAGQYYELAKKLRKKIERATTVIADVKTRMVAFEHEQQKQKVQKPQRKKEWYEKFHWFSTSTDFFVLGGRDATTNETIVKKHTEKHDLLFHTEMAGSPFFVLKTEGKQVDEQSLTEVAIATACYSRAWRLGLSVVEVFWVKPEQVSKTAESGEYVARGSFVIRGKKEHKVITQLEIAVGKKDDTAIGGPISAILAQTKSVASVVQGKEKQSDIAKKIAKKLGLEVDDVTPFLPAGGLEIKK